MMICVVRKKFLRISFRELYLQRRTLLSEAVTGTGNRSVFNSSPLRASRRDDRRRPSNPRRSDLPHIYAEYIFLIQHFSLYCSILHFRQAPSYFLFSFFHFCLFRHKNKYSLCLICISFVFICKTIWFQIQLRETGIENTVVQPRNI